MSTADATLPTPWTVPPTPAMEAWYGSASHHVARFLHRLRCIPASTWLETIEVDPHLHGSARPGAAPQARIAFALEEQADYVARQRLHDALESMPAVVRRIRHRINTDLAIFHGILPEAAVQRMRRAAHLAAFALAAHPLLDADDVARLYRPFAELIPPPRLTG